MRSQEISQFYLYTPRSSALMRSTCGCEVGSTGVVMMNFDAPVQNSYNDAFVNNVTFLHHQQQTVLDYECV